MNDEPPDQQTPRWLIDEVKHAGRENLDPEHVARYDHKQDSEAKAEVALLRRHGLGPNSVIVEFGPGTGQFTSEVARACERLVAVDPSPVMLARLAGRLSALGIENVEAVRSGFLGYQHAGRPADFAYSRLALHHLPDFWKALALVRVRRSLKPGGVMRLWDVVYDFEPGAAEERIEAWCATGGESIETEWVRDELEEHVRDEHSTFSWILDPMIVRCGFEICEVERSGDGIFSGYVLRAA